MYWVIYCHLPLVIEITLQFSFDIQLLVEMTMYAYQEHVNSHLLRFVLEIVDVCSRHTLCSVRQNS